MKRSIPMKSADEYDALTKARRFYHWRAGAVKKIKKAFNKRERKDGKRIREDCEEL